MLPMIVAAELNQWLWIPLCWSKEERKVKREREKVVALSCTQVHERTKE